jgi:hypothetical protein
MATSAPFDLAPFRPYVVDLVRVGKDGDGGYVVSRAGIDATRLLLSFGISVDWSFEEDLLSRVPDARLFAVEGRPSISTLGFATRAARGVLRGRPGEVKHWWHMTREFQRFFSPATRAYRSAFLVAQPQPRGLTWDALAVETGIASMPPASVFVKMDIEGGEYDVLPFVLADAAVINSIVIEFHCLDTRWESFATLAAQLDEAFALVHMHGCNFAPLVPGTACPTVIEATFLNRALLPTPAARSVAQYPIEGLDQANDPSHPDYQLDFGFARPS